MAITVDVGKIKLVWRGTYNPSTAYTVDDVVQYNDGTTVSAYINIADSTGEVPSTTGTVNSTYWNLLAQGASAASSGVENGELQYKSSTGFGATSILFYNTSTNRLGIGTTNPVHTLEVEGNSKFEGQVNIVGVSTFSGTTNITNTLKVHEAFEKATVTAGAANATSDLDIKTSTVYLFTTNSGATWTHNIRGDGSTSLNSMMDIGQSIVVAVMSKQNNTSYYTANITIDGAAQTEYFTGGAPTSGQSTTGYDGYFWTIIKTADATFTVLATQTEFSS